MSSLVLVFLQVQNPILDLLGASLVPELGADVAAGSSGHVHLVLVGCNQKAVSASEVYSFPEPTTMITVSFYSQGEETAFEIGSEEYDSNDLSTTPVINWFYDLKLTACDEPEAVEGSESYEFYVKGESAFTYEDRGSEAYIIIGGSYYKVSNPSAPPIN